MTTRSYNFFDKFNSDPVFKTQLIFTYVYILTAMAVIYLLNTYLIEAVHPGSRAVEMEIELTIALLLTPVAYYAAGYMLTKIKKIYESQKLFMSNASHELKGPISVMKLNSELALMEVGKHPNEVAELVRTNLEQLTRMTEMLDTLRKIAAQNYGLEQLTLNKMNLGNTVEGMAQIITKQFTDEKNIKLRVIVEGNTEIEGNQTAIEEMVYNLLKNAANYTPAGGSITAKVLNKVNTVRLIIADTGVGIPKGDLPYIFNAFYRGGSSGSVKSGGSGLGLSIVNEIAHYHKAKININSTVGKGTDIIVEFPSPNREEQ